MDQSDCLSFDVFLLPLLIGAGCFPSPFGPGVPLPLGMPACHSPPPSWARSPSPWLAFKHILPFSACRGF